MIRRAPEPWANHLDEEEGDAEWFGRVMADKHWAKQRAVALRAGVPLPPRPRRPYRPGLPPQRQRQQRPHSAAPALQRRAVAAAAPGHAHCIPVSEVPVAARAVAHAARQKKRQQRLVARRRERQWHPMRSGAGIEHAHSERAAPRPRSASPHAGAALPPPPQTTAQQTATASRLAGDPDGAEGDGMRDWLREVRDRAGLKPRPRRRPATAPALRRPPAAAAAAATARCGNAAAAARAQQLRAATAAAAAAADAEPSLGAHDEFRHLNRIENSPNELLEAQQRSMAALSARVRLACVAAGEEELLEPAWRKVKRRQLQRQAAAVAAATASALPGGGRGGWGKAADCVAVSPIKTAARLARTRPAGARAWMPAGVAGSPIAMV